MIFTIKITPINNGKILKPIYDVINPKNGGINVVPIYALAICIPIIACDLSAPKFLGVSCKRLGYMGAQPSPIVKNPGSSKIFPMGKINMTTPQAISVCPKRII
jgi:hypothetical protein